MKLHVFSAVGLFIFAFSFSQEKDIDTVFIFDNQLRNSNKFQNIETLKQEDLLRNTTNLSEALRFQSPVYIKENGRGAVSSPSFRGTTAQQTAFVWNGINVNSVFLGQGDINNLGLLTYDQLSIKSGGGSVIYGSGAIGGTIHLNNELSFNKGFGATFFGEYGSFNTRNALVKTSFSDEKLSVNISANLVASDNDYEVPEQNYLNRNGAYDNKTINISAGYRIASKNTVYWQTHVYTGMQHYPVFTEYTTPTRYRSDIFRTLLDWRYQSAKIQNSLKTAYLQDEFQYFDRPNRPKSSGGLAETYVVKNDFNYLIYDRLALNMLIEYLYNVAEGYQSGIQQQQLSSGSAAVLARWKVAKPLDLEAGIKQEFVEGLRAPFLFSFSGKMRFTTWYDATLNISKNFRYPTFNDLYWQPGGNPNLKPEVSYQAELRNTIKVKNFTLSAAPFYLGIENMIRWLPNAKGIWSPVNTHKVESSGVESQLNFHQRSGAHKTRVSAGYTFTDSRNVETGQLLSYVSQHRVFATAAYTYRFMELYVQGFYNSTTFTTEDEAAKYALPAHFIANAGLSASVTKNLRMGFKVQNLFDNVYATSASYPMPKRNYSLNLLINL